MTLITYTTGPIENVGPFIAGPQTKTVSARVDISNRNIFFPAIVTIKAFSLDGTFIPHFTTTQIILPNSSIGQLILGLGVAPVLEFQIQVFTAGLKNDVSIGVFGFNVAGEIIPSSRVVHRELTRIAALSPG
jgi:hypothetical protein